MSLFASPCPSNQRFPFLSENRSKIIIFRKFLHADGSDIYTSLDLPVSSDGCDPCTFATSACTRCVRVPALAPRWTTHQVGARCEFARTSHASYSKCTLVLLCSYALVLLWLYQSLQALLLTSPRINISSHFVCINCRLQTSLQLAQSQLLPFISSIVLHGFANLAILFSGQNR